MRQLIYILALCLFSATVSADIDTLRDDTSPIVMDCRVDFYNPNTNDESSTTNSIFVQDGENFSIFVGVAGLDALIGNNTRDSAVIRVAHTSGGDAGNLNLYGVYKFNMLGINITFNDWKATALEWATGGAEAQEPISTGTFNSTDGGGDDITTEVLDAVAFAGGAGYEDNFVDNIFFPITTLDTVWWKLEPQSGLDQVIQMSESGTNPLEIIIYSTAVGAPAALLPIIRTIIIK